MAASYDGDGNRVLEINLREKNYSVSQDQDEDQDSRRRRGTVSVEEEEKETPEVQTPGNKPVEPDEETLQDEPVPEDPGRDKGGVRNIFIFGFLSYLKGLFSPFVPTKFADDTEPAIEYYWYRETAAAGLSDRDITMVQA